MNGDFAGSGLSAVLEQENPLPPAKRQTPADNRDGKLGRSQRRAQVRGHIVRTFVIMLLFRAFGRETGDEPLEVAPGGGRGIFLDQERCRGVTAKKRAKTGLDREGFHRVGKQSGDGGHSGRPGTNRQAGGPLA